MRTLRTLFVLLIALAMPIQGFAAVMLACASSHGQSAHQVHEHIQHHGGMSHDQHASGHLLSVEVPDEVSIATSGSEIHDHSRQECSACTSCCSLVTLVAPSSADMAHSLSDALFTTVPVSVVDFMTGGQERPPRLSLV